MWEGCGESEIDWKQVAVDGVTPPGTQLTVEARTAADVAGLAAAPFVPVTTLPDGPSEADLDVAFAGAGVEDGAVIEVQVVFESLDREHAPLLQQVELLWACPTAIE